MSVNGEGSGASQQGSARGWNPAAWMGLDRVGADGLENAVRGFTTFLDRVITDPNYMSGVFNGLKIGLFGDNLRMIELPKLIELLGKEDATKIDEQKEKTLKELEKLDSVQNRANYSQELIEKIDRLRAILHNDEENIDWLKGQKNSIEGIYHNLLEVSFIPHEIKGKGVLPGLKASLMMMWNGAEGESSSDYTLKARQIQAKIALGILERIEKIIEATPESDHFNRSERVATFEALKAAKAEFNLSEKAESLDEWQLHFGSAMHFIDHGPIFNFYSYQLNPLEAPDSTWLEKLDSIDSNSSVRAKAEKREPITENQTYNSQAAFIQKIKLLTLHQVVAKFFGNDELKGFKELSSGILYHENQLDEEKKFACSREEFSKILSEEHRTFYARLKHAIIESSIGEPRKTILLSFVLPFIDVASSISFNYLQKVAEHFSKKLISEPFFKDPLNLIMGIKRGNLKYEKYTNMHAQHAEQVSVDYKGPSIDADPQVGIKQLHEANRGGHRGEFTTNGWFFGTRRVKTTSSSLHHEFLRRAISELPRIDLALFVQKFRNKHKVKLLPAGEVSFLRKFYHKGLVAANTCTVQFSLSLVATLASISEYFLTTLMKMSLHIVNEVFTPTEMLMKKSSNDKEQNRTINNAILSALIQLLRNASATLCNLEKNVESKKTKTPKLGSGKQLVATIQWWIEASIKHNQSYGPSDNATVDFYAMLLKILKSPMIQGPLIDNSWGAIESTYQELVSPESLQGLLYDLQNTFGRQLIEGSEKTLIQEQADEQELNAQVMIELESLIQRAYGVGSEYILDYFFLSRPREANRYIDWVKEQIVETFLPQLGPLKILNPKDVDSSIEIAEENLRQLSQISGDKDSEGKLITHGFLDTLLIALKNKHLEMKARDTAKIKTHIMFDRLISSFKEFKKNIDSAKRLQKEILQAKILKNKLEEADRNAVYEEEIDTKLLQTKYRAIRELQEDIAELPPIGARDEMNILLKTRWENMRIQCVERIEARKLERQLTQFSTALAEIREKVPMGKIAATVHALPRSISRNLNSNEFVYQKFETAIPNLPEQVREELIQEETFSKLLQNDLAEFNRLRDLVTQKLRGKHPNSIENRLKTVLNQLKDLPKFEEVIEKLSEKEKKLVTQRNRFIASAKVEQEKISRATIGTYTAVATTDFEIGEIRDRIKQLQTDLDRLKEISNKDETLKKHLTEEEFEKGTIKQNLQALSNLIDAEHPNEEASPSTFLQSLSTFLDGKDAAMLDDFLESNLDKIKEELQKLSQSQFTASSGLLALNKFVQFVEANEEPSWEELAEEKKFFDSHQIVFTRLESLKKELEELNENATEEEHSRLEDLTRVLGYYNSVREGNANPQPDNSKELKSSIMNLTLNLEKLSGLHHLYFAPLEVLNLRKRIRGFEHLASYLAKGLLSPSRDMVEDPFMRQLLIEEVMQEYLNGTLA
ncbi:MAG: hypothetical protein ChlgKO_00270 [Chlamydiales bacterium]